MLDAKTVYHAGLTGHINKYRYKRGKDRSTCRRGWD